MTRTSLVEELYRKHYNYLFMVAYNICDRVDMSQDVVQDGIIRALLAPADLKYIFQARAYTSACIRNAAFERLGKEARQKAIRRDFVRSGDPRRVKMEVRILAALSKMKSLANREILDEIYFHDKTRRELAREQEVKPSIITRKEKLALVELTQLFNLRT